MVGYLVGKPPEVSMGNPPTGKPPVPEVRRDNMPTGKPVTGVPLTTFLATHPKGPHTFTLECELADSNGAFKLPVYMMLMQEPKQSPLQTNVPKACYGAADDAKLLKTLSDGGRWPVTLDLDWKSPWNGTDGTIVPFVVKVY
jgi:hypothetical protein